MKISPFVNDSTDKGYPNLEVLSHLNINEARQKQVWIRFSLTYQISGRSEN